MWGYMKTTTSLQGKFFCQSLVGFFFRVFWVKIAKLKVNLHYSYCSKLIGEMRRETEFRQWRCRNSAKKKQEREYATEIQSGSRERRENNKKVGERRENNHCRNFFFSHNFGNAIAEIVGEKNFPYLDYGNSIIENVKKRKKKKGEKDYGNGIAEIGKKNFPCFRKCK